MRLINQSGGIIFGEILLWSIVQKIFMAEIYGAEAAKFVDILKEKLEQLKGVSRAEVLLAPPRTAELNCNQFSCEKRK